MDSLMFIFLSVASFAAVIVQDRAWLNIDPGILGLALSLLIQLAGLFQWCIRQVSLGYRIKSINIVCRTSANAAYHLFVSTSLLRL